MCGGWRSLAGFATILLAAGACTGESSGAADAGADVDGDADGGADTDSDTETDGDTDTETDTDTGEEWCPELESSCGEVTPLDSCGDDSLGRPRLIFPLSGRHVRDRRPRIVWEGAADASQYRLEIARDRDFTEPVYYSNESESLGDDRFEHVVSCDLDCGAHFFRVLSVTAAECAVGAASHTWEMFVGMAPGDLDRDGTPDLAFARYVEPAIEMDPELVQAWAVFDIDEKGGQYVEPELVVELEALGNIDYHVLTAYPGDTDGDGAADLLLYYIHFDTPGDWSTAGKRALVFTDIRPGTVQGIDDAIRIIDSEPANHFSTNWHGLRFTDFDGDGLADMFFRRADDCISIFLGSEAPIAEQDINDPEAEVCFSEPGSFPYWLADLTGDGLADIYVPWGMHSFVIPGQTDPPASAIVAEYDLIQYSPGADPLVWGDWYLGWPNSYFALLGDVDFDGYLDLSSALEQAAHLDDETGGCFVAELALPGGEYDQAAIQDHVFLLDAPGEYSGFLASSIGDITGDEIDDFCLHSEVEDLDPEIYHANLYWFHGSDELASYAFFSEADAIEEAVDGELYFQEFLADMDGDGINDWFHRNSTTEKVVHLSASDQLVTILLDDAHRGEALPEIY